MVCVPFQRGHLMEGCVHIRVVKGEVRSIIDHFEIPEGFTGVLHCTPEALLTDEEFSESHPGDVEELEHYDLMWIDLRNRKDGGHDIDSRVDVNSDVHFLDMIHHLLEVWHKCNLEKR